MLPPQAISNELAFVSSYSPDLFHSRLTIDNSHRKRSTDTLVSQTGIMDTRIRRVGGLSGEVNDDTRARARSPWMFGSQGCMLRLQSKVAHIESTT